MVDKTEHPLFEATRKLMVALDRLEQNLQQVSVARDRDIQQQQQLKVFTRENEALKEDKENLNKAISELAAQYEDLQHVATSIHGKLDDSVKRISEILES